MAVQLASEDLLPAPTIDGRYRIGAWVIIAGVTMLFTGLSSAYVVRAASAPDWQPLMMPRVLWLSTALILISSLTLELARKPDALGARSSRRQTASLSSGWLSLTLFLGLGFLASQLAAWRQLARQGIFLASNPHSSFFYLLTAVHGLHLVGGLLAVLYLLVRVLQKGRTPGDAGKLTARATGVSIYWHFMDFLWLYLFALLFVWRAI